MMAKEEIGIYLEKEKDGVSEISLQGIAAARGIAGYLGATLSGVLIGKDVKELAKEIIPLGLDVIYCAEDERLEPFRLAAYKKLLASLVNRIKPRLWVFPSSTQGNSLAATIASVLDAGALIDCDGITLKEGALLLRRLEFDGKVFTHYSAAGPLPLVVSIKDGSADPAVSIGHQGKLQELDIVLDEEDLAEKFLERKIAARTVNLKEAKTIVCAGAGVGTKENFPLIEELAEAVQGEIGATRAAVDAGWVSADRQIGQTGVTVKPDLYIACGVSGAAQHRVGMIDSETIVSINIDPNAPIFKFSHYGIVGDLSEVIPKLIRLIKP